MAQVAESAALTQVRDIFDIIKLMAFSETGRGSSQAIINAMTVAYEVYLVKKHTNLARSWTPQRCKLSMLGEFRPSLTSASSTHAKLAWFHPDGAIQSIDALWLATAIWVQLVPEMRGSHMEPRMLRSGLRVLRRGKF